MGDTKRIDREKVQQAGRDMEDRVAPLVGKAKNAIEREDISVSNFTSVAWRLAAAYELTHNYMTRELDTNKELVTGFRERLDVVVENSQKTEDDATAPPA